MEQVFTVSEVNRYIKDIFVKDYVLNRIYMKGEVSNCKYHTSGHIYFTLKDETGQMACVMFAGQRTGLSFRMADGQAVIVFGSIGVYERDGKYQMYAKEIRQDGIGILYERFAFLKQKLLEEGLFDAEHKKPIPKIAASIGIVTSKTGAAIQDMIQIAKRRNPYIKLYLYPAKVQGEGAAESIAAGIQTLDAMGLSVLIIGRGGGSIEDLWAFNEEVTARAVFACRTPVISAVGHETDFTICDYAADLRAPTPSAAAELACCELDLILASLAEYHSALASSLSCKLASYKERAEKRRLLLSYLSPAEQIKEKRHHAVVLEEKLAFLIKQACKDKRHQFSLYAEQIKALSPIQKLKQGFSYVSKEGRAVTKVQAVKAGDKLRIDVSNGQIEAEVLSAAGLQRE